MAQYTYPTSSTASDTVNPSQLEAEVLAVPLATTGIVVRDVQRVANGLYSGGDFVIEFASPLDPSEESALDAVVAAHVGAPTYALIFHASSLAIGNPAAITSDQTWQDLGGVVTTPSFFVSNLNAIIARIVGDARAVGSGAELRLVEDESRVLSPVALIPDTGGSWGLLPPFNSDQPPSAGQHVYTLQGRLNGANSASLRYTSLTLMELQV